MLTTLITLLVVALVLTAIKLRNKPRVVTEDVVADISATPTFKLYPNSGAIDPSLRDVKLVSAAVRMTLADGSEGHAIRITTALDKAVVKFNAAGTLTLLAGEYHTLVVYRGGWIDMGGTGTIA